MLEKRGIIKWLIAGFLMGVGLVWGLVTSLPDKNLHIVACDVGQGDAILITWRSTQLLVDGGPQSKVIDCLSRHLPFWDKTIETVVMTHAQSDHMGGLISVFQRFDVEQFVANGIVNDSAEFWEFRDAVVNEGAEIHLPKRGDKILLDGILLEVLWPKEREGSEIVWEATEKSNVLGLESYSGNINETSVVFKLTMGEFNALFTGDIGQGIELALISDGVLTDVELLKVGHHGSKYSSSSEFLREIEPELAVISVGGNNWYGHPTSDTLMRLDTVGAKVYRTDETGDVEIVSDGERYWVED